MNSSIEIVEAAQLAQKLIDRTTEGKNLVGACRSYPNTQ